MSGNNHETDAFDLANAQQDTTDTRLINTANKQFGADVLPSEGNDEADNHRYITVKQDIDSDVDENSMKNAKIGDAANNQFEADILPSGEKEETDDYKYITVKQEVDSDNDESNMNDAKMDKFETSTVDHNEPQASSSVGSNHESATVNTTYIRDKLDKPTDFPRLTVFRDAHDIAGQRQLSSQPANLTHPAPSVAGGTLISMGIFVTGVKPSSQIRLITKVIYQMINVNGCVNFARKCFYIQLTIILRTKKKFCSTRKNVITHASFADSHLKKEISCGGTGNLDILMTGSLFVTFVPFHLKLKQN